jgi:hypothetical protein
MDDAAVRRVDSVAGLAARNRRGEPHRLPGAFRRALELSFNTLVVRLASAPAPPVVPHSSAPSLGPSPCTPPTTFQLADIILHPLTKFVQAEG